MGENKGSEDGMDWLGIVAKVAWKWLKSLFVGSIEITQPHNRDVIEHQPSVTIRGKSTKSKKKVFWLLTRRGFKYWPQTKITVSHDGRFEERVNVNKRDDKREHSIVLAGTNQFADSMFTYYKTHCGRIDWEPLIFQEDGKAFKVADEIVITVLGTAHGGTTNG